VFQANLAARELRKHGVRVRLPGQPFRILSILLERPGEVVTREEMRQRLWASDTFVDFEHSLNSAIKKLRAALDDSPENSRYIETVPRVGYRFVAPAELVATAPKDESTPSAFAADGRSANSTIATRLPIFRWPFTIAACCLGAMGVVAYGSLSNIPTPKVTRFVLGTLSEREDGFARMVTDGVRVYFLERQGDHDNLVQTSTAGGEAHAVDSPFRNTRIFDVSPDHSEFLIGNFVVRRPGLPLWIWPVQGGSPIRIANVVADDASWCLDGQHILYTRDRDIHIVRRDGNDDRVLLHTRGNPGWIRWHPDGTRFSFTVFEPQSDAESLWEASADGSHGNLRFPGWSDPPSECCGEWTPDGKYFVFTSARSGFANLWAVREKRSLLHWRAPQPVQLTPTARPLGGSVLTREGTRAFLSGWNEGFDFVRYDLKGRRFLPSLYARETLAMWFSKDGAWVVSMSFDWTLWRSRRDGSERLQLTSPPLRAAQVQWSPDGKNIAFEAHLPGKPVRTYVVSVQGGPVQEVFSQEGEQSVPAWSPDGSTIAVALNVDAPPNAGAPRGIYLINWTTRKATKIPASEGLTSPQWSPDGKYFIAKTADERSILRLDARTQKWDEIAGGTALSWPTWSRDSKYLFVQKIADPGQSIYRLRAGNFKGEQVLNFESLIEGGAEGCVFLGIAPDGSLIIRKKYSGGHVYALDLDLP
jgi:Tol biopolymer transport system component/DNA-binding winged helix-turn-helix (wHTH) protein